MRNPLQKLPAAALMRPIISYRGMFDVPPPPKPEPKPKRQESTESWRRRIDRQRDRRIQKMISGEKDPAEMLRLAAMRLYRRVEFPGETLSDYINPHMKKQRELSYWILQTMWDCVEVLRHYDRLAHPDLYEADE